MAPRIQPTVGRVVYYFHRDAENPDTIVGPQAAILCAVNEDGTINVAHFDDQGNSRPAANVLLLQDEDAEPDDDTANWCEWMPFQKGQAAKTEELERQARAGSSGSSG